MAYTLRPYQKEAVDATLAHFRKRRTPAVIVLPTGAGKSLVVAELARLAKGRVLVLTHVKELVEQNYLKYCSYGLEAGIFSAGLGRKESKEKVIFGGIQSVAKAPKSFFSDFSLLIIDECHRVSADAEAQYSVVLRELQAQSENLCVLGLTATPYRMDLGWLYRFNYRGKLLSEEKRFFDYCIYDLSLRSLVEAGYLTPPVQIESPVTAYDFSSLELTANKTFKMSEIEEILKEQKRFTPGIIKNIVELAEDRQGVMIFTSTISHAKEVLSLLPENNSALILGNTPPEERERLVNSFKAKEFKFLVNVSVLTTGFDAPHVDLIAILRPTESVALYQQIVGRGLRLSEGKKDCLVLDYTGIPHDIFAPEIRDDKPFSDAVAVKVDCPQCDHTNDFWGVEGEKGETVEHFGKKCSGAVEDLDSGEIIPCGFRYRYQTCPQCGAENDLNAKSCLRCHESLKDEASRLKEARAAKNMHVMRPDTWTFEQKKTSKGLGLEVRYYDLDGQFLSEYFSWNNEEDAKAFHYNFNRLHTRLPGRPGEDSLRYQSISEVITNSRDFRMPAFLIAVKVKKYWRVREKIFSASRKYCP